MWWKLFEMWMFTTGNRVNIFHYVWGHSNSEGTQTQVQLWNKKMHTRKNTIEFFLAKTDKFPDQSCIAWPGWKCKIHSRLMYSARVCSVLSSSWMVAHQAPLSMGFFWKNTGVGCHFFLQGIFQRNCMMLLWVTTYFRHRNKEPLWNHCDIETKVQFQS